MNNTQLQLTGTVPLVYTWKQLPLYLGFDLFPAIPISFRAVLNQLASRQKDYFYKSLTLSRLGMLDDMKL